MEKNALEFKKNNYEFLDVWFASVRTDDLIEKYLDDNGIHV
jgi:hypothetical protein